MYRSTLLQKLHQAHPLPLAFRSNLRTLLLEENHKGKQQLLRQGAMANKIYYLISGHAKAYTHDAEGREVILWLYQAGQIMTAADSFFSEKSSKVYLSTIDDCRFLVLEKKAYQEIQNDKEMVILTRMYLLEEKHMEEIRAYLLNLNQAKKVAALFKNFDAHHLPNKDCASFLQMTGPNFSLQKGHYNKNNR